MGVLGETSSWCFCSGGGKSERVKGGIFNGKGPAIVSLSNGGTGFLIHRSLLLTTHGNLPSAAVAEAAEIQIHDGRLTARLVPQRFFLTSNILDLTIVGLDVLESESNPQMQQPQYLKISPNPCLELGSEVYVLGHASNNQLVIGEGKIVIATDNLIKLLTDGGTWRLGSAGFDVHGNLAFMVCDPMKCTSSPTTKSTSTSSSSLSWKKDVPMQFGIPMPIICDWLYQHWDGNLDEISKPRLPLRRLISPGQRTDSSASFTLRSVFKPAVAEITEAESASQIIPSSRPRNPSEASCSVDGITHGDESPPANLHPSREQGIPTPEIYESPKVTSEPVRNRDHHPGAELDINVPPPPSGPRTIILPLPIRQLFSNSEGEIHEENAAELHGASSSLLAKQQIAQQQEADEHVISDSAAQANCHSEMESSGSPMNVSEVQHERDDGFSSDSGTTMYSAETMESRNYPSPKRGQFQQVGRSQSSVSCKRWGSDQNNSTPSKSTLQRQRSMVPARRTHSQTGAVSRRSHDYCSPTVSSIMKKRNSSEQQPRTRPANVQDSPRWMF